MRQLVGILLAAGRGLRFDPLQRRDKLLEPLEDGLSVIAQSIRQMRPWVDELVVVTRPGRAGTLQAACQGLDAHWVEAACADAGMGASLKSGLAALALPQRGWLIGLGDMPWIQPSTYQHVRQAIEEGRAWVRPFSEGRPGHPVGCATRSAGVVMALPDAAGLGTVLQQPGLDCLRIDVSDTGCARDVDTPADLE